MKLRVGSNGVSNELHRRLVAKGITSQQEYQVHNKLRADVAILRDGRPILLIECKDYKRWTGPRRWRSRTQQYNKYLTSGIPFQLCNGLRDVERVLEWVLNCL
jgi:hypothetical protein